MKLRMTLPIQAYASFEIDLPSEWDEMEMEEQAQFILDYAENETFLCEECTEKICTDFEQVEDLEAYDLVMSKLESNEFDLLTY